MDELDSAERYFVSDRPDARLPATRLRNILDSLQKGRRPSALALSYLQRQGLAALHRLALGESTYEEFSNAAAVEKVSRERAAENDRLQREAARRVEEAEQNAREAVWAAEYERKRQRAEAARLAREADPKHIAKVASQRLRARYGIDQFIEKPLLARLMGLLRRVDAGNRFTEEDVLWLRADGKSCDSDELQAVFHEREAEFLATEYRRTRDPWNAVNASGHYRKCDQAKQAHDLLVSIPDGLDAPPKLKSAIRTTHGGVMRDLGRLDEALRLGDQAHVLTPRNFRPCTLLGAVHVELGNLTTGWEWYRKAEERGASERSVDQDLRAILLRANSNRRAEIKSFLLRADSARYQWVNDFSASASR
ncbi:MAG: hypothetical protein V4750_09835 [Pseudomonadota bacterium]